MSRSFTAATPDYLELVSVPISATPLTICGWLKPSTNAVMNIAGIMLDFTLASAWTCAMTQTTRVARARVRNDVGSGGEALSTGAAVTLNTWNHFAAVFTSTTSRAALCNGANKGTDATSFVPTSMDRFRIGTDGTKNVANSTNGLIAHVALWNVALADAEIVLLAAGANPRSIQAANLINYWTLDTNASPETPVVGTGNLTLVGAPTYSSDNPTIDAYGGLSPDWAGVIARIQRNR